MYCNAFYSDVLKIPFEVLSVNNALFFGYLNSNVLFCIIKKTLKRINPPLRGANKGTFRTSDFSFSDQL
jgi:hypothetical protein